MMIKVLPKDVADKIAAGEVIESPVSIVKELIENSIDANSTSITCEITGGGKEEIRITDNGVGIPKDQVETAFLRHATSKISKIDDLKSLGTLGFRGEALASIAAVSRTELITRTADEAVGTRIILHGGTLISKDGIGCPVGTTIIVRDLFYNVPARLKFLKSDAAEAGKVIDMISRLGITRPDIRFSMISNGKPHFSTSGNGDLKAAILAIFKDREYRELIPLDAYNADKSIHIYGYISRPSFTRTNRRSQFFFVNGRTVKSDTLDKGVVLGYKERLFEGRHPIVFLFLDMDPKKLDVNVHPNKKEVRFNDDISVITAVEEAIKTTIGTDRAVIKATDTIKENTALEKTEQLDLKEYLKTKEHDDVVSHASSKTEEYYSVHLGDFDISEGDKPFDFNELVFSGAIFGTYLIATDSQNFYMFDQHAAHERINYERFVGAYLSNKKESQILLTPFTFDVPGDMSELENDWIPIINNMGYNVEPFGEYTYIVREVPTFMSLTEAEDFVNAFVDAYNDDRITENKIVIDKLITKACKSSIKANDYINDAEINALIQDLKNCRNPFSCPHGRPTFIKFSKYDIEKLFKRIV